MESLPMSVATLTPPPVFFRGCVGSRAGDCQHGLTGALCRAPAEDLELLAESLTPSAG